MAKRNYGMTVIEFFEGDFAGDFRDKPDHSERAERVAHACRENSVEIVAIAAVNNLFDETLTEYPRSDVDNLRKWLNLKDILNFQFIRMNTPLRGLSSSVTRNSRSVTLAREVAHLAAAHGVTLVLENHPHVLKTTQDFENFVLFLEMVDHPNFLAAPDFGAIGPLLWHTLKKTPSLCSKLSKFIAHIHVKPHIFEQSPNLWPLKRPLKAYLPFLTTLVSSVSDGRRIAISYEHTDFAKKGDHPPLNKQCWILQNTLDPCAVAIPEGITVTPKRPSLLSAKPPETTNAEAVVDKITFSPDTELLRLLADGVARRLKTSIQIHDFATASTVTSGGSTHTPCDIPTVDHNQQARTDTTTTFCSAIQNIPAARTRCIDFHAHQLDQIKSGDITKPQLTPCPMGLMTLSVPVSSTDSSTSRTSQTLYGAIISGPWLELGTEGMATDSLQPYDNSSNLLDLLCNVPVLSVETLKQSKANLQALVTILSNEYQTRISAIKDFTDTMTLVSGIRTTVDTFSTKALSKELDDEPIDKVISDFHSHVSHLLQSFTLGSVVLVIPSPAQNSSTTTWQPVQLNGEPEELLPTKRHHYAHITDIQTELENRWTNQKRTFIAHQQQQPQPGGPDPFAHTLGFCVAPATQKLLTPAAKSQVSQILSEIIHSTKHLYQLRAARERQSELELFIARLRHATNAGLQQAATGLRLAKKTDEPSTAEKESLPASLKRIDAGLTEVKSIMNRLTSQIQTLHRTRGPSFTKFAPLNIPHLISQTIVRFERNPRWRHTKITATPNDCSLPYVADASALQELFENLIENALKFSKQGHPIRIHSQRSTDIPFGSPHHWPYPRQGVRIAVSNIGPEIRQDEHELIFLPFKQGSNLPPDNRANNGTGIGLAVCRRIAEDHGGRLYVVSGKISPDLSNVTFFLELPHREE